MIVDLKQGGKKACVRDRLYMSVNTSAVSVEQTLTACSEMLCGQAALGGFILLRALHTSTHISVSVVFSALHGCNLYLLVDIEGLKAGTELIQLI